MIAQVAKLVGLPSGVFPWLDLILVSSLSIK